MKISVVLSPKSVRRAIAALQSASNSGYKSTCWTFLSIFSSLSSTSFKSSSISSTFSSSSLVSLSDEAYSAIRLGFLIFFGDLLSTVVC
jgi:hypothetical protein